MVLGGGCSLACGLEWTAFLFAGPPAQRSLFRAKLNCSFNDLKGLGGLRKYLRGRREISILGGVLGCGGYVSVNSQEALTGSKN
jgi:hypothetical protein